MIIIPLHELPYPNLFVVKTKNEAIFDQGFCLLTLVVKKLRFENVSGSKVKRHIVSFGAKLGIASILNRRELRVTTFWRLLIPIIISVVPSLLQVLI
jgi:hypothetical protein